MNYCIIFYPIYVIYLHYNTVHLFSASPPTSNDLEICNLQYCKVIMHYQICTLILKQSVQSGDESTYCLDGCISITVQSVITYPSQCTLTHPKPWNTIALSDQMSCTCYKLNESSALLCMTSVITSFNMKRISRSMWLWVLHDMIYST